MSSLVIQTAFPGDAILTLPMIEKLKEKYPDEAIDVLCIPSTAEIFSASPFVNNILVMDKKNQNKSVLQLKRFAGEIKLNGYSRIISPHKSFRTSLLVLFSNVRETVGFSNSALHHVYKNVIHYRTDYHEVQRNLSLVGEEFLGDSWKIIPKIRLSSESKLKVDEFLKKNNIAEKAAAVAPGSIWETKKYPEKYFKELIAFLTDEAYSVIILGGETDAVLCERLAGGFKNVFSTAGYFTIVETIELLKSVQFLITNDSAPTHMGMCADIPVLTIYCSTVPGIGFYPYNNKSLAVSYDNLPCKPCGIHGFMECPIKTFSCGYKLVPEIIKQKINELIHDRN